MVRVTTVQSNRLCRNGASSVDICPGQGYSDDAGQRPELQLPLSHYLYHHHNDSSGSQPYLAYHPLFKTNTYLVPHSYPWKLTFKEKQKVSFNCTGGYCWPWIVQHTPRGMYCHPLQKTLLKSGHQPPGQRPVPVAGTERLETPGLPLGYNY